MDMTTILSLMVGFMWGFIGGVIATKFDEKRLFMRYFIYTFFWPVMLSIKYITKGKK